MEWRAKNYRPTCWFEAPPRQWYDFNGGGGELLVFAHFQRPPCPHQGGAVWAGGAHTAPPYTTLMCDDGAAAKKQFHEVGA